MKTEDLLNFKNILNDRFNKLIFNLFKIIYFKSKILNNY